MSKTENQVIKFEGLVRWASVPPNLARTPPKDYINPLSPNDSYYSIEVECPKDRFDKLIKAGIPRLTSLRVDEETGKTYLRIKATKVRRINGEDVTFSDPFVIDKNNNKIEQPIGNGSKAVVIAELASSKMGKVLRLKGVQVLNMIPFVKTSSTNVVERYKDHLETETNSETINDFL